jgi:hypothetical protein
MSDLADPLEAVRRARARLEAARTDLVDAMRTAESLGATQRELGAAAGVSHGEVWKVLRRGKRIS